MGQWPFYFKRGPEGEGSGEPTPPFRSRWMMGSAPSALDVHMSPLSVTEGFIIKSKYSSYWILVDSCSFIYVTNFYSYHVSEVL